MPTTYTDTDLSPDQYAALLRFQDQHGTRWRKALRLCWLRGEAYPGPHSDARSLDAIRQWLTSDPDRLPSLT